LGNGKQKGENGGRASTTNNRKRERKKKEREMVFPQTLKTKKKRSKKWYTPREGGTKKKGHQVEEGKKKEKLSAWKMKARVTGGTRLEGLLWTNCDLEDLGDPLGKNYRTTSVRKKEPTAKK